MISVIVPVYNAEKYLHRCVDSILVQSYTDFELLLIDDGSTDGSGAICDDYAAKDNRVCVFHKENGGVSSARNVGLDNAKGEYVTFCDADDYVDGLWLMDYQSAIEKGVHLAIQGVNKISSQHSHRVVPKSQKNIDKKELINHLFSLGLYGYTWNKLFINEYSLRFDERSSCAEDSQFVSEYMEAITSFVCINEAHYYYYLPDCHKQYGGDYYYSFIPIAQSLDRIYNKKLPDSICNALYPNIKGLCISRIIQRHKLDAYSLDLYKRLVSRVRESGLKSRILNFFIVNNNKLGGFSCLLLKLIHRLKTK